MNRAVACNTVLIPQAKEGPVVRVLGISTSQGSRRGGHFYHGAGPMLLGNHSFAYSPREGSSSPVYAFNLVEFFPTMDSRPLWIQHLVARASPRRKTRD